MRRRPMEMAASMPEDLQRAQAIAEQVRRAARGMLRRQLGKEVEQAVARLVGCIVDMADQGQARAWAAFSAEEEKVAFASAGKQSRTEWDAFIRASLEKGAGVAHKLATKVYAQRLALVQDEGGGLSSIPQAEMRQQVDMWGGLGGTQQRPEELRWQEGELLPRPTTNEIRSAASSFRQGTSVLDGWHPRIELRSPVR